MRIFYFYMFDKFLNLPSKSFTYKIFNIGRSLDILNYVVRIENAEFFLYGENCREGPQVVFW